MAERKYDHLREEWVTLYKSGLSSKKIGKKYKVSQATVLSYLRAEGVDTSNTNWDEYASLWNCYHNVNDISIRKIAEMESTTKGNVSKVLKRNGYIVKTSAESQRIYQFNQSYFEDIDTHEKAYWLGFIYADGNIRLITENQSILQISLSIKDKEHLERFKRSLETEQPLFETDTSVHLVISSKQLVKGLMKYGVTERKTFDVTFPENLPKEFNKSFILGYFDGDGSIYTNSRGTAQVSFLGTKNLLTEIREMIIKELDIGLKANVLPHKSIYGFKICGNRQARKLGEWLYKENKIYLKRKKYRFDQIFIKQLYEGKGYALLKCPECNTRFEKELKKTQLGGSEKEQRKIATFCSSKCSNTFKWKVKRGLSSEEIKKVEGNIIKTFRKLKNGKIVKNN